ncbi:MAG TPA: AAA family ATPase, partial [Polyangiaceae bacterium]|nr:AAA family ATPase [Polyangiaceae bacterium]
GDAPSAEGLAPLVGATPRLAARLAALSPPGSVLVTAASQKLLRDAFELEAAGAQAVDGLAAPLRLFRLVREHGERAATPEAPNPPLVGRDQEVELLLERFRRAAAGAGQSSLITGEPGIGKSRLVREVRARLSREAHTLLEGRCSPDTQNSALYPIVDALGRAFGLDREPDARAKAARLEARLAGYGQPVDETLPLLLPLFCLPLGARQAPADASSPHHKRRTFDALLSLLFAAAEERPVLLLVEDLHWADPTTIELLAQLAREAPSAPLFVLLTARPEFAPPFSTAGMLQLHLGRLDPPRVAAMVAELTGHKALPAEVLEQVVGRTDGVPLFVEELTRVVLESGALVEREGRYELRAPL